MAQAERWDSLVRQSKKLQEAGEKVMSPPQPDDSWAQAMNDFKKAVERMVQVSESRRDAQEAAEEFASQ